MGRMADPPEWYHPLYDIGSTPRADVLFQKNEDLLFENTPLPKNIPLQKIFYYVISAIPAAIACDYAYNP
jgi:hypothetical protein